MPNNNDILPILGHFCDIMFINYIKHLFIKNGYNHFSNDTNSFNLKTNLNCDYRESYLINPKDLININICLLINIRLRVENPIFNAKLRQEYLWNNIKIFQLGSKIQSSYKYSQLTTNVSNTYKILQGKATNFISLCMKQSKILCLTSIYNLSQSTFNYLQKLKIIFLKKTIYFVIKLNSLQLEQINLFELNLMSQIHANYNNKKKYIFFFNTNQSYLKNNYLDSKLLLYQSSHFNQNYNFVDVFLPITTIFETRIKMYINILGLLRRIPKILPFYKLDILDDLDSVYFIILMLPILKKKIHFKEILNKLYFNLPLKIYNTIQTYHIFFKKKYNDKFEFQHLYYNTIYSTIFKNFYKITYLEKTSITLTTLTNIFFNNSSNYYNN